MQEKCLEESNVTVEKQQKVITDLQLKNEALQVQLDEEVANQKEIKTKLVNLTICMYHLHKCSVSW